MNRLIHLLATASVKRSFSCLKRIKSVLWNRMAGGRRTGLALLSILSALASDPDIVLAVLAGSSLYSSRTMCAAPGVIANSIRQKLQATLQTKHLEVINESFMHNVPKGAETHFKVVVVSDQFDGLTLLKRHRLVNDILKVELQNGVHALSIVAKTTQQWDTSDKVVESSPNCKGGFGK